MESGRCLRIVTSSICAAALACAAADVSAQEIYRHVSLVGGVTFTDQRDPEPEAEAAQTPARRPAISQQRAATVNANEAERRLAQAHLKREQGIKPLPGEQVQGSKGTVLSYRYWRRQEKLRLVVEQAQRRLSETHRPQIASR